MNTGWRLTLALALLALGLGLFVYFMPRSTDHGGFAVSELNALEVKRIRVERAGEPPILLERTGDRWRINEPFRAAADPAEANRLLAALGARSPQKMAPVELARFDLDKPPLRLVFDEQTIAFGMVSAVATSSTSSPAARFTWSTRNTLRTYRGRPSSLRVAGLLPETCASSACNYPHLS